MRARRSLLRPPTAGAVDIRPIGALEDAVHFVVHIGQAEDWPHAAWRGPLRQHVGACGKIASGKPA
jgi:hypothetical protein